MTDDADECIHGLGPIAACTICNGRERRDIERYAELEDTPRIFAAKYAGQCAACNLPILVGQLIAWRRDHPPVHDTCQ